MQPVHRVRLERMAQMVLLEVLVQLAHLVRTAPRSQSLALLPMPRLCQVGLAQPMRATGTSLKTTAIYMYGLERYFQMSARFAVQKDQLGLAVHKARQGPAVPLVH